MSIDGYKKREERREKSGTGDTKKKMMKKLKKEHEDEKNERLVDFNLKSKTLNTPGDAKLGKFQALIG